MTLRLLANENIPLPSIRRLRQAGHDVVAAIEDTPGAADIAILARAVGEQRYILAFDRDYGELVYRLGLPSPPGILYVRFAPLTPTELAERLLPLLSQDDASLQGQFTVIDREILRQRPLP